MLNVVYLDSSLFLKSFVTTDCGCSSGLNDFAIDDVSGFHFEKITPEDLQIEVNQSDTVRRLNVRNLLFEFDETGWKVKLYRRFE